MLTNPRGRRRLPRTQGLPAPTGRRALQQSRRGRRRWSGCCSLHLTTNSAGGDESSKSPAGTTVPICTGISIKQLCGTEVRT
eukprot:1619853-Rhodomonas_salina.2